MRKDTLVFYFLGALILVIAGFFLFSKKVYANFFDLLAGSNVYLNDLYSVKRKDFSFNESFVKDGRFIALRRDWLAPTSFSELSATSSELKKTIDFKIGNQQLFKVVEKDKK